MSKKNLEKLVAELDSMKRKLTKALKPSKRSPRKPSPKNTWANGALV